MARVLVVEDDDSMAVALKDGFTFEGYEITLARDGEEGLRLARGESWDLVVLDVMLPKMSGYDVCKELRSAGSRLPILMLTARGQEIDKVLGLKLGADDYVTKPFNVNELLARANAFLRRHRQGEHAMSAFGDCEVDLASRTVRRNGSAVDLTPKEFDLLAALLERDGAVVSRQELLTEVWRYASADVATRTVDVHIAELRRKLEADASKPVHILTVRKAGYRLRT